MAPPRPSLPSQTETQVLVRSRRRCCLCVFLDGRDEVRQGQIAHINQKRDDHRLDNLAWLCLEHHDIYDSRTSQSKGITEGELRHYRDELLARNAQPAPETNDPAVAEPVLISTPDDGEDGAAPSAEAAEGLRPWRFPLWQMADHLEFFAYTAAVADGVCLIERIDLPDGRIVIACVQPPGNPGRSITNAVEEISAQVRARFEIPADKLVWLENYSFMEPQEWLWVRFHAAAPDGAAGQPYWTKMTPQLWKSLRLSPKRALEGDASGLPSRLKKHFPWPPPED